MVYQAGGKAMPEAMQSSCPGPSFGFWPTENTEVGDEFKHKCAQFELCAVSHKLID